jgi:hypothetical protein
MKVHNFLYDNARIGSVAFIIVLARSVTPRDGLQRLLISFSTTSIGSLHGMISNIDQRLQLPER